MSGLFAPKERVYTLKMTVFSRHRRRCAAAVSRGDQGIYKSVGAD
jgi:hypothetical protein